MFGGDQIAIRCAFIRGGTSRGLFFHDHDLPADRATRERIFLAAMGSPDQRQINGVGGADSHTSKVMVLARSSRPDVDVDYT
ncbi:MAG: 3-methylitaconate isomerase, partial [Chloroflexi bacterium]|nr:3-methylitaconate isomerase [Chloroflexota bacterium]